MFKRLSVFSFLENHVLNYPTPNTLSYLWNFGSLAGVFLLIQIITGIFLSMHYIATTTNAFDSIEHVLRDVNYGWLLKTIHANGASFFFLVIYCHIGRAIYFQSFRHLPSVWISGVVIFILMMATAFLGYVLPWGQMSFWGATVITNLFSAVPVIGKSIVAWLWGGYSINTPTLMRFYTLHYCLPFIILGVTLIHIFLLHEIGSSFAFRKINFDSLRFFSYFVVKDLFGLLVILVLFFFMIIFYPNYLGHPDNYIPANSLVTPPHIVPEWYFLPFYAILRCIPSKLGGVFLMFSSIFILFFIPFSKYLLYNFTKKTNMPKLVGIIQQTFCIAEFQPLWKVWFWLFTFNFVLLGYLGSQPAVKPFIMISLVSTFVYFFSLTIGCLIALNLDTYFSELFFKYYGDIDNIYNNAYWGASVPSLYKKKNEYKESPTRTMAHHLKRRNSFALFSQDKLYR